MQKGILKRYIEGLYKQAERSKENDIKKALRETGEGGILLDAGCWDCSNTVMWAKAKKAERLLGIEIVSKAAKLARKKGITVYENDLNKNKWPLNRESVDCVLSNLVIEHLTNVDHFIAESYRVLKKGGYTIVSTNNLSSWHNIISLLLGWAPFDLTNISAKTGSIGNPLGLHIKERLSHGATYTHKCIYTAKWLKKWYGIYGFKFIRVYGSGYYPFPPFMGKIDKTHSAFITIFFQKE